MEEQGGIQDKIKKAVIVFPDIFFFLPILWYYKAAEILPIMKGGV